jgi:hypothetical protein
MGAWLAKSLTPRIKDSYIAQCCVTDFERKKQAHEAQHSDSPRLIKDLSQSKDLSTFSEPEVDTCTKEGYLLTRDALGSWRLRFFSLRSSGLYICTSHSDERPRGYIPLLHDPDRPPPEVSALPTLNERSFQIFFDCSWLLGAGTDEDRERWLAAIAAACAGPRPSNLEVADAPAQLCAGPLTRFMMDGSERAYWAVLLEDGAMLFYTAPPQPEAGPGEGLPTIQEQAPKIRLHLRSKHGVATARELKHFQTATGERGDIRPVAVDGCFQLLCGLECFICAESPDEMHSWIQAIDHAIAEAAAKAAANYGSPSEDERAEEPRTPPSPDSVVGCGSVGSLDLTSTFMCGGNRRSCLDRTKVCPPTTSFS